MNPVTIVWSLIASAGLTLAFVNGPLWWRYRDGHASPALLVAAVALAGCAYWEVAMLQALTVGSHAASLRWNQVPLTLLFVALAAFVHFHMTQRRTWLGLAAIVFRVVAATLMLAAGESGSGMNHLPRAIDHLASLLLLLFVADATVSAWRRGDRSPVVLTSAGITLFLLGSPIQQLLVHAGVVQWPVMLTPLYLPVIAVGASVTSAALVRARQVGIQLREREEQAALTAEAINIGFWSRDIDDDSVRATGQWREMCGFDAGEPLTTARVIDRVHADDRDRFAQLLAAAPVPDTGAAGHLEHRTAMPDGRWRWLSSRASTELGSDGRPLRRRGASVDITLRKQMEQDLLRMRRDLAHAGRVSVMGQLASSLAHEISQPLGAILRNAEAAALFMQHPDPDLAEISAILEDIHKDDQRAGAVIARMRGLLKRQEVEMLPLRLDHVLADVVALVQPDASERQVELRLALAADLPRVLGDSVQLEQVLLNLILNGMDALESLAGSRRQVAVSAGRAPHHHTVEVSVSDTGRGIAANEFDRIFEPFFTTKAQGIGMGLHISRIIIEAHGGRLWAENSPGGGARFRFTLPEATGPG